MSVLKRRGRLRLRLEPVENDALTMLLDELRGVVAAEDADDPVVARLFPSAYPDDADAEADYRSITEDGLRSDRLQRIDACAGELGAGHDIDLGDVRRDIHGGADDVYRRWIQTLNDLRLAIGTRIGVSEDEPELAADDPQLQGRMLYHWLTGLQDALISEVLD